MIFTNLQLGETKVPRTHFAGWLGVVGIFFSALVYWAMPEKPLEWRPLQAEETETVILVLGQMERHSIAQVIQLEDFLESFTRNQVPSFVDSGVDPKKLVEGTQELLRFSPEFFSADPWTQSQALAKLLGFLPKSSHDEIAVSGTRE